MKLWCLLSVCKLKIIITIRAENSISLPNLNLLGCFHRHQKNIGKGGALGPFISPPPKKKNFLAVWCAHVAHRLSIVLPTCMSADSELGLPLVKKLSSPCSHAVTLVNTTYELFYSLLSLALDLSLLCLCTKSESLLLCSYSLAWLLLS